MWWNILVTTNYYPRNTKVILLVELNMLSVEFAVNKGLQICQSDGASKTKSLNW